MGFIPIGVLYNLLKICKVLWWKLHIFDKYIAILKLIHKKQKNVCLLGKRSLEVKNIWLGVLITYFQLLKVYRHVLMKN